MCPPTQVIPDMIVSVLFFALVHSALGGGRIVGGEQVPITEYPHQMALFRRQFIYDMFQCGGVIISPKHALTAAHCKRGPTEQYSIIIGESEVPHLDNTYLMYGKTYKLASFIVHPNFDQRSAPMYDNDIAVITIDGALKLDGISSRPIEIASEPILDGIMVEVSGYGNTERLIAPRPRSAGKMRQLKAAYVPTVAHNSCVKYLKEHHPNYYVTENMICAGHPCQEDACQGDSGGPLIDDDGKLVGIVSYGKGCGSYDPGVYTNLYLYRDFINENTGGLLKI